MMLPKSIKFLFGGKPKNIIDEFNSIFYNLKGKLSIGSKHYYLFWEQRHEWDKLQAIHDGEISVIFDNNKDIGFCILEKRKYKSLSNALIRRERVNDASIERSIFDWEMIYTNEP